MTRRAYALLVALAGAGSMLAVCKDTTPPRPIPGWLSVRLTTPNGDDGGISFTVTGPAIDSARTTHPQIVTRLENGSTLRVIVAGNLSSGVVSEIHVPDTRAAAQYSATIQELAVRTTYAQRATAGYALVVVP